MSDRQIKTKFELLPNEILIECFEYFNGVDIIYSFDQLNYRFNKLIRSISLRLDFENIHHKMFNECCVKLKSDSELRKQIHSLHLSNNGLCYQMQPFLTYFSLNEFICLQSLTLTQASYEDVEKLKSMPPLLTLCRLRLIDQKDKTYDIVASLSSFNLQTLVIPNFSYDQVNFSGLSSVTHLTMCRGQLKQLFIILENLPLLKCVNVKQVIDDICEATDYDFHFSKIFLHLTKIIFMSFFGRFNDLIPLSKKAPNLKSLTISIDCLVDDVLDANQWQNFISSSLLNLTDFKFIFQCNNHAIVKDSFVEKLKRFQSDFWQKEHEWYTEYSISSDHVSIYTIPYILNKYYLKPFTEKCSNDLTNNLNTFKNVTNLAVDIDNLTGVNPFYFPRVSKLDLFSTSISGDSYTYEAKHIRYLKNIVNLSHVKCLKLSYCDKNLDQSLLLPEILKEAQQVSSLSIYATHLTSLSKNEKLCQYLNQMIKKLTFKFKDQDSFSDAKALKKFCEIFSNIEQLTCAISRKDFLFSLIKYLPKLLHVHATLNLSKYDREIPLVKQELQQLGVNFCTHLGMVTALTIWTNRGMCCQ